MFPVIFLFFPVCFPMTFSLVIRTLYNISKCEFKTGCYILVQCNLPWVLLFLNLLRGFSVGCMCALRACLLLLFVSYLIAFHVWSFLVTICEIPSADLSQADRLLYLTRPMQYSIQWDFPLNSTLCVLVVLGYVHIVWLWRWFALDPFSSISCFYLKYFPLCKFLSLSSYFLRIYGWWLEIRFSLHRFFGSL